MILVLNDDGIHSEGLRALGDACASLDDAVAPRRFRLRLDLTNHDCRVRLSAMELGWP